MGVYFKVVNNLSRQNSTRGSDWKWSGTILSTPCMRYSLFKGQNWGFSLFLMSYAYGN
jgi:hypothetical protein